MILYFQFARPVLTICSFEGPVPKLPTSPQHTIAVDLIYYIAYKLSFTHCMHKFHERTDRTLTVTTESALYDTLIPKDHAFRRLTEIIDWDTLLAPYVAYYFTATSSTCSTNLGTGGTDSGWQTSTVYSDTGLGANKCYAYTVTARDAAGNYGATSTASTTYTHANTPSAPTLASVTATSLTLTNNENGNPTTNPTTLFAIYATSTDGTWNNRYVASDGTPSASPVWLSDAQLTTLSLTSLTAETLYSFSAVAKNQNDILTATSSVSATTTSAEVDTTAPTPNPLSFSSAPAPASTSSVTMTANTGSDPSTPVSYYFTATSSTCSTNLGTGGTDSGWQTSTAYSDTGLGANKCYAYTVTARDAVGNYGATSTASTTYTHANTPSAPTLASVTATSLTLTNNENGNPTTNPTTLFAIYATSTDGTWNNRYVASDGTPSASPVWLSDAQLTTLSLTSLTAETLYSFSAVAKNQNDILTATSSVSATTTLSGGVVSISSGVSQQFYLGQGTTTLSNVTITDAVSVPTITTTNDIRIAIASSTTPFRFDTGASVTFSGTASGKVSASLTYENNATVAVVHVTTNFSGGDTLIIEGLRAGTFSAISTTTSSFMLYTTGSASGAPSAVDPYAVRITGAITLANHTSGQVVNQFQFLNSTNVPIFAFEMSPSGESATSSAFVLALSSIYNIDDTHLTNIRLYRDVNGSRALDGGDVAVGGVGTYVSNGSDGTITFAEEFTISTTEEFIVVSDLSGVTNAHRINISLSDAQFANVTGFISGVTPVILGAVTDALHYKHLPYVREASAGRIGVTPDRTGILALGGGGSGGGARVEVSTQPIDIIGTEYGFLFPSTAGIHSTQWTSTSNVYASDDTYATTSAYGVAQDFGTFNFGVPSTNTITGISVKLEASVFGTAGGTIGASLSWNDGAQYTSEFQTGSLTTNDAVYTLGDMNALWGASWVPEHTSNANFLLRLVAYPNSNTIRLDALQVRIHHLASGGSSGGSVPRF
jgi:hypothetical protein